MALTNLRNEVAQALIAAGLPAHEALPERVTPPLAIVSPGNPYAEVSDNRFGEYLVRLDVMLVMKTATNPKVSSELDDAIELAVSALDEAGFDVVEVSSPFLLDVGSAGYLSATVRITHTTKLGGS